MVSITVPFTSKSKIQMNASVTWSAIENFQLMDLIVPGVQTNVSSILSPSFQKRSPLLQCSPRVFVLLEGPVYMLFGLGKSKLSDDEEPVAEIGTGGTPMGAPMGAGGGGGGKPNPVGKEGTPTGTEGCPENPSYCEEENENNKQTETEK
jgi:hypothetical protein